jgi:putative ABC transport system permease protein
MTNYYLKLALRGLLQHRALTALMVIAIGLGIAATMTGITILARYGRDPIPQKSQQLFAVRLDTGKKDSPWTEDGSPPNQLSYSDATALMRNAPAKSQSVMYATRLAVQSDNPEITPSRRAFRTTYNDFFQMFALKFRYGGAWSDSDDAQKARVTVLTAPLAEFLFGNINPVGKQVLLGSEYYLIAGVVETFDPKPKFYDLNNGTISAPDEAFIPFTTAIDLQLNQVGNTSCNDPPGEGWAAFLASECIWLQYWAELPNAAAVSGYQQFLNSYADEQAKLGRFTLTTRNNHINSVTEFLQLKKVVPEDSKVFVYVSIGFLLVCLINAIGLMLAKFLRRSTELGVRRALGASKRSVFIQHLFEAGVIGAAGALLGAVLTYLGLLGMRALYSELKNFVALEWSTLLWLVLISISATVLAGLIPAWRVSQLAPARALKAN